MESVRKIGAKNLQSVAEVMEKQADVDLKLRSI